MVAPGASEYGSPDLELVLAEAGRLSRERNHTSIDLPAILAAILDLDPALVADAGSLRERLLDEIPRLPAFGPSAGAGVSTITSQVGAALRDAVAIAASRGEPAGAVDLLAAIAAGPSSGLLGTSRVVRAGDAQHPPSTVPVARPTPASGFSTDLTAAARAGELDPVIGREAELTRLTTVLARRVKRNAILVGPAGVGKTALVEGLALRIAEGTCPPFLRHCRILTVSMGHLLSNTRYRGDFEARVTALLAELQRAPDETIVFIDEVHLLVGAGGSEGGIDAANLLKPVLSRNGPRFIGATTRSDYVERFSLDPALVRRFRVIRVDEPTPDECTLILLGLRRLYEQHHGVSISERAIVHVVAVAKALGPGRHLPDSALDLLDEACALAASEEDRSMEIGHVDRTVQVMLHEARPDD